MGLFSKKQREPVVHPEAARSMEVPAALNDVIGQLRRYSDLHSPKHGVEMVVSVGEASGRTWVKMPDRMHPWIFHNIGFWLLDTPDATDDLVLRSSCVEATPAYALVRDPDLGDCLCGVDGAGTGWTIHVPTNDITKGEQVPATAPAPSMTEPTEWRDVVVLVEDPGHGMNPANDITRKSRARLIPDYVHF